MFCESKACLQKMVSKKWLGPWEGMVGRRPLCNLWGGLPVLFETRCGPVNQVNQPINEWFASTKKTMANEKLNRSFSVFQSVPGTFSTASGEKKQQQNPWVSVLICWSGNLEFKAIFILILVAQRAVGIEQLESEWYIREIMDEKHSVPISSYKS